MAPHDDSALKPAPGAPAPEGAEWAVLMSAEQRESLESLSRNLARAALTTQTAMAGAMLRQDAAAPSADPFHLAPALTEVIGKLAAKPEAAMRAQASLFESYLDLWRETARRAAGEPASPVVAPAKGDRRFNDPAWTDNPVFDVMKQSYLLTANWLNGLIAQVDDVDPQTRRRVEFFTKALTDAFSPSNFLASNPAALRAAVETRGESLVRGAENFARDLERGGGQLAITQTDLTRFKIGENVATAPGKVVFQNALFQLLQFAPSTAEVHEIPLLILPPWINKYYILDLRPENSMIRWLTAQGFTVFVASWVNPGPGFAHATMADYARDGALTALDKALEQTGAREANVVGYCIGGTLLATAMALMAARAQGGEPDDRIASATFFAAQQDFEEAGDLLLFTDEAWRRELEERIQAGGGVLPAGAMADTFNALRANDLIWSFFVGNYLMGQEPAAFDLLFWNADQTRMPGRLHVDYLTQYYAQNRLARGEMTLDELKLDLKRVTTPVYVQSSREDHIAPMRSVYRGARLFGGPTTFTLAGSGHIAGVINHPDAKKYQHWTNPALPETAEQWLSGAAEAPGSWWPHWAAWLKERSGGFVAARDPSAGPLKPIEDAPGSYVKVRS